MPRRPRVTPLVIAILGWTSGLALAGILAPGGIVAAWPAWSRAAWAQQPDAEPQPSEWQRLVGPLPYRPAEPDSGWLTEDDLTRAVDLIADLGRLFARLSETDPDSRAHQAWAQSEAAYGGAAKDLGTRIEDGKFRIVVSEGSSLAIIRRGQEIWVDSDLAGAWDVERVRRARWNGDDWPDVAILSGLLFDLWRAEKTAAGDAWMEQQRNSIDLPEGPTEDRGTAAATLLTRYGFLKDLFLNARLLRAATADFETAALWRDRAQEIQDQIETLLRTGPDSDPDSELAEVLRQDWAAYETRIEHSSADRARLVLAARRPDPAQPATGDAPPQPAPAETAGEQSAPAEPTFEMIVPAGRGGRDAGPASLEARIAELEAARSRDQVYIALLLARAAEAARAAEEARAALAAAPPSGTERAALAAAPPSGTERAAEEPGDLRRRAEDLAADLEQARSAEAELQAKLAEAQSAQEAAEKQAADLDAQLTAARSGTASAAEETDSLRRRTEDLAAELDNARSAEAELQAQLAEAQSAREAAEKQATDLGAQLTAARSGTASAAEETDRLRRQAEDLAADLEQARSAEAELQAKLAEAQNAREAAEQTAANLGAQLTAARSGTESATAETDSLRQRTEDLAADLEQARSAEAELQAQLAKAQSARETAEQEAAAQTADLRRQLAARNADLARAEAQAARRAETLAEAEAKIAGLDGELEKLQAAAESDSAAAAAGESERAALETKLAALETELAGARQQGEAQGAALDEAQRRAGELGDALAEARRALAAAQEQAGAEAVRAGQAEAAAAQANDTAEQARQDLAAARAELARLREEVQALRQERSSAAPRTDEARPSGAGAPSWLEAWRLPILAAALLAGGLGVLLAVLRRPAPPRRPLPVAPEAAPAHPPERRPAAAPARTAREVSSGPPGAPPAAARPAPAAPVTSATIVDAVRRQDWAAAEAQFARLSGISAPRLEQLLDDPSGELLALACRAADLDRLTFATLYLLQGQGSAVADPEIVAGAVSLFEKTGPAEAQQLLAERYNGDSRPARGP